MFHLLAPNRRPGLAALRPSAVFDSSVAEQIGESNRRCYYLISSSISIEGGILHLEAEFFLTIQAVPVKGSWVSKCQKRRVN